ncbi:MAG: hypothetical protein AMXMBFR13_05160 [Phycisphaerae bacterium]
MCQHCSGSFDFSRREMLIAAAGAAAAVGGCSSTKTSLLADPKQVAALPPEEEAAWPLVRVAYLRPKGPYWLGWPGTAWDVDGFTQKSRQQAESYARQVKVRLVFESEPLYDAAAVDAFVSRIQSDKPDGVLVFPMHMNQWGMADKIAKAGRPTIIFAGLGMCFTGHIQQISKLPGVYLASTADYDLKPVRFGLKMIRTNHDIRRMKVAVLVGNETKEQVLEPLGLTVRYVPRERFPEVLQTVEVTPEVKAIADEYGRRAAKIVEPSNEDILNASRNYFAALQILKDEGCHGISMECLGLVAERKIPCPPCMAWSKLLDVGIPGVCEADIKAVMGHSLCVQLLDKPGFMQDPVPDTVNNTFIGAHCVSPTRLDGYDQVPAKFILRSHSESDLGVSLQVLWEPGREVTVMQFLDPGRMILGKGTVLRNLDTPPAGGCRTSVELALDGPPDTRDTKGFHQLFIAGNHVRDFQAYGQMFGIATEHI